MNERTLFYKSSTSSSSTVVEKTQGLFTSSLCP